MFLASVHLTDDVHGLARVVVSGEEEDRRIHDARGLVVKSAEQLSEVARIGADRSEPTGQLDARTELIVVRS